MGLSACSVNWQSKEFMWGYAVSNGSRKNWGSGANRKGNSRHALPVAENILNQQFKVYEPNKVWTSDLTYVPTDEGWLYLAGHKDLFTSEIVGYSMGARMTKNLIS